MRNTSGPMNPATSFTIAQALPPGWTFVSSMRRARTNPYFRGLEAHHVHALGRAVRELRSLTRLDVESELLSLAGSGVIEHFFHGCSEDGIRRVGSREALEHEADQSRVRIGDLSLRIHVAQDRPGEDFLESEGDDDVAEGVFHSEDVPGGAIHGIRSEDDVSGGEGESVEHLPNDILDIVRGRVRLDARAQVAFRADMRTRQGVEYLLAGADQFLVGHQLDEAANHVAVEARHDGLDGVLRSRKDEFLQLSDGPTTVSPRTGARRSFVG